ncbi:unnamed protein product [Polarella glacialis]|uniref:K Homology domain-containing protein n=1 Tax=Polarella glacialis TaxID=89957 RepID=A0A813D5N0_POLGL|nr:unnamed protein product [Polarella glacialis]
MTFFVKYKILINNVTWARLHHIYNLITEFVRVILLRGKAKGTQKKPEDYGVGAPSFKSFLTSSHAHAGSLQRKLCVLSDVVEGGVTSLVRCFVMRAHDARVDVANAEIELFERDLVLEIRGSKIQRRHALNADSGEQLALSVMVHVSRALVPQEAVGFVTGRAGNFLRTIEEEQLSCRFFCEVDGSRGRNKEFEKLAIFGDVRARRGAELKVLSAVETKVPGYFDKIRDEVVSRDKDGSWGTDTMTFQDDELSYALGKQGGTRKKLERSSAAIVRILSEPIFAALSITHDPHSFC